MMAVLHTRALSCLTVPVCFLHLPKCVRPIKSKRPLLILFQIGLIFPMSLLFLMGGTVARSCMATLVRRGHSFGVPGVLCLIRDHSQLLKEASHPSSAAMGPHCMAGMM